MVKNGNVTPSKDLKEAIAQSNKKPPQKPRSRTTLKSKTSQKRDLKPLDHKSKEVMAKTKPITSKKIDADNTKKQQTTSKRKGWWSNTTKE